jgi:hypothetical protein
VTARDVNVVPFENIDGHTPGRDCRCGPSALRVLETGGVAWRHRQMPAGGTGHNGSPSIGFRPALATRTPTKPSRSLASRSTASTKPEAPDG